MSLLLLTAALADPSMDTDPVHIIVENIEPVVDHRASTRKADITAKTVELKVEQADVKADKAVHDIDELIAIVKDAKARRAAETKNVVPYNSPESRRAHELFGEQALKLPDPKDDAVDLHFEPMRQTPTKD